MPSDPAKKYSKDGSISSTIRRHNFFSIRGKRMVASPLQNKLPKFSRHINKHRPYYYTV
jgi:hypothetical protein